MLNPQLGRLGSEYGYIAASVLQGHGYGNPFGYASGPTAWMPPGVVGVYVLVFWLFGIKTYSAACALLLLKALLLALSVGVMLDTAAAWGLRSAWPGLAVVWVVAFLGRFDWLGLLDMDESLLIFVSSLALRGLAQARQGNRPWHFALAAALPLISPPLALGFSAVLILRALAQKQRSGLWLLLPLVLAVGGWTVRNQISLNRAVPLKSNLWFEFFLSNVASPNGLLCTETLVREHPIHPENSTQMSTLGEIETCELYRRKSLDWLREHPVDYVGNVASRAYSVFVRGYQSSYFRHARQPVAAVDADVVKQAGLLWVNENVANQQFWLYSELAEPEARELLRPLPLQDSEAAWQSFRQQMSDRQAFENQPTRAAQSVAYSLLPTLAMLAALWSGGWRRPVLGEAIVLYLAYFLPYLLVSYLQRYQVSAMGLQIWLVWLAFFAVRSADHRATPVDPSGPAGPPHRLSSPESSPES